MEDILPPLLEKINQDFDERAANSKKLKRSILDERINKPLEAPLP